MSIRRPGSTEGEAASSLGGCFKTSAKRTKTGVGGVGGVGGWGTDGWLGGGAGRTSWVGYASVSENRRLGRVWIQFILENIPFTPCDGSFLESVLKKPNP